MKSINLTDGVYRLEGTQMEVEVILASAHPESDVPDVYTIRMRYPRIIHSEVMTHRVLGRNARSSRAVPVKKMLAEIDRDPFVPWHWGRNQPGMQAEAENNALVSRPYTEWVTREVAWIDAAEVALEYAEAFHDAGYHKQVVNRLLEPFMYIDVLITSTNWSNFLWLRDHKDAEPHLQDLARMVSLALDEAKLKTLGRDNWHLPYITDEDLTWAVSQHPSDWDAMIGLLCKISAARCARISYAPFDGDASYEREIDRYNFLVSSDRVHASPLEHQAKPDSQKMDYDIHGPYIEEWATGEWHNPHLSGNLDPGWIQFRKTVPGEFHA